MVELTTERMEGQGSYGGFECLWAGTPSAGGWGSCLLPDAPESMSELWGQRRKPELFLVVLEYYPFSPSSPLSALSLEPGRQAKSRPGPPTLPVNTTTLLRRIPLSSAQPSPTPCLIFQAQRNLSTQRHNVPKQGPSPSSDFLAKTVTVKWPCISIEASIFYDLSSFHKLVTRKSLATSAFSNLTLVERE